MSEREELLERIRETVTLLVEENGAELVEMSYRWNGSQNILQLLVDTPGGIRLEECAHLNRLISEALDRLNLIEENYLLEVASPGLDRPLKTERDFERVKGQAIRVFLTSPLFYRLEYEGTLEELREDRLVLRLREGTVLEIPMGQLKKGQRLIHF